MPRKKNSDTSIPHEVQNGLKAFGANIRRARIRRRMPIAELAERARLSAPTVRSLEHGMPGVGIGAYASVLWVLGLDSGLRDAAAPERDVVGMALEAARAPTRARRADDLDDDF